MKPPEISNSIISRADVSVTPTSHSKDSHSMTDISSPKPVSNRSSQPANILAIAVAICMMWKIASLSALYEPHVWATSIVLDVEARFGACSVTRDTHVASNARVRPVRKAPLRAKHTKHERKHSVPAKMAVSPTRYGARQVAGAFVFILGVWALRRAVPVRAKGTPSKLCEGAGDLRIIAALLVRVVVFRTAAAQHKHR